MSPHFGFREPLLRLKQTIVNFEAVVERSGFGQRWKVTLKEECDSLQRVSDNSGEVQRDVSDVESHSPFFCGMTTRDWCILNEALPSSIVRNKSAGALQI